MKYFRVTLLITSCSLLATLSSCLELFPEETVVYQGHIYEAYDTSKPVDSVVVKACTKQLSLFPNWPNCDTKTFTDANGYFYISFQADGLAGRGLSYGKVGYKSLDSCLTLNDGTFECFIDPLQTFFYIYSPTISEPPSYDSLSIRVQTIDRDTAVFYHTESFENSWGETTFYWTADSDLSFGALESYTHISVPDNSEVTLVADYYKDNQPAITDFDTLYCPKGVGNRYKILN